jgi:hypothetical protein
MHDRYDKRLDRLGRIGLVWLCTVLIAVVSLIETTHFHSSSGSAKQRCSICIAAHSVARPAQPIRAITAPPLCLGLLFAKGPTVPDYQSVLSLYIRPPPLS